jgi:hypothetical protein
MILLHRIHVGRTPLDWYSISVDAFNMGTAYTIIIGALGSVSKVRVK